MLSTIIGAFLIAHGAVHAILAAAPIPNDPSPRPGAFFTAPARSWILSRMGSDAIVQWTGILLVAMATLGFILAGMGVLGVPGLSTIWRTICLVSAGLSLLLLVLFWHSWLIVGLLINVAVFVLLLIVNWPPHTLVN